MPGLSVTCLLSLANVLETVEEERTMTLKASLGSSVLCCSKVYFLRAEKKAHKIYFFFTFTT